MMNLIVGISSSALFFVLVWVVTFLFLAYATGWRRLMAVYPKRPLQFPTCWSRQHIALRVWGGYNGIVIVCADGEAVTFDLPRFFRIGHGAMTVPWDEITVTAKKKHSVKLQFQRVSSISVTIRPDLAERFVVVSNGRFSNQPAVPPA